MGAITVLGQVTTSTFLNMESHKLHLAFSVDPALATPGIIEGQPVKLNAAGQITPLLAADDARLAIGISIMAFDVTQINSPTFRHMECTVAMRGYCVINAEVGATAVVPGPVKYAGYNATTGFHKFVNASAGTAGTTPPVFADGVIGIAIEPGAATGDEIIVVYH